MKSNFELFKDREFLGDKLLNVVFTNILLEKGLDRNLVNKELSKYTNNAFLSLIFDSLDLKYSKDDISFSLEKKLKGNTVEEFIWNYFLENDYLKTKELIKKEIESIKNE